MHIIALHTKNANSVKQREKNMNKRNFYMGMGMGIVVGGISVMAMRPKKSRGMKSMAGKTLKAMGEVADSVSDIMGW